MVQVRLIAVGLGLLAVLVLVGCSLFPASKAATPSPEVQTISLPAPRLDGPMSLEQALLHRRSIRSFTEEQLTLEEISQLLWAAQGITRDWGARTAPSAGALYPLEIYVATPQGLYHYVPQGHRAVIVSTSDVRNALWAAGLKQDALKQAAVIFVIAAIYERTAKKYGERAERYVKLEAGHACQNLLLQAVTLGLGAVPIGAFYDSQVQSALGAPTDHEPLYLIPVGHPGE